MDDRILNQENRKASEAIFQDAIRIGLDFKLKDKIRDKEIDEAKSREIMLAPLPLESQKVTDVLDEFVNEIMPYSYNFASPTFMGFPDAGNSVGAITGSILSDFLQQNLINQSFCSLEHLSKWLCSIGCGRLSDTTRLNRKMSLVLAVLSQQAVLQVMVSQ